MPNWEREALKRAAPPKKPDYESEDLRPLAQQVLAKHPGKAAQIARTLRMIGDLPKRGRFEYDPDLQHPWLVKKKFLELALERGLPAADPLSFEKELAKQIAFCPDREIGPWRFLNLLFERDVYSLHKKVQSRQN